MKDSFGREIKPGDVVVYGTRFGSSQDLNVAIVKEIVTKPRRSWDNHDRQFIRAECVAGTGYEFTNGRRKWDSQAKTYGPAQPVTSRNVTLTSPTLIVINGADLDQIIGSLRETQRKNSEGR